MIKHKFWSKDENGECGPFPFNPKLRKFRLVHQNGTDQFGLVQLEYLVLALMVVHFDRSDHFSWSKRKCPSPFDKIDVPSTALLNPTYKNNNQTCGGLDRVCAPRMYCSTGHVKCPKFQTGIFVEWKAACVLLQACENHVLYTAFLCVKKPVLGKTKTTVLQSFS